MKECYCGLPTFCKHLVREWIAVSGICRIYALLMSNMSVLLVIEKPVLPNGMPIMQMNQLQLLYVFQFPHCTCFSRLGDWSSTWSCCYSIGIFSSCFGTVLISVSLFPLHLHLTLYIFGTHFSNLLFLITPWLMSKHHHETNLCKTGYAFYLKHSLHLINCA